MQYFRKILVGVDLSHADHLATSELNAPTREAVKRAVWLAAHSSAELTFYSSLDICAHTEEVLHELERSTKTVEDDALAILIELAEQAKKEGVAATAKLEIGSAWEGMIRQVVHEKHDLVIVGTRDHNLAARFLFGSTGMKLLRNCPCPVWITKPDPNWDDLNILTTSDFSDVSDTALKIGIAAGEATDGAVHLLHSVEEALGKRGWFTGLSPQELKEQHNKQRTDAEEKLKAQIANIGHQSLKGGVQIHVTDGAADIAIVNTIERLNIDLLVMGTMARSGIPGLFIGNTAERLLAQVPCSVLAIKPPGFECPVSID